MQNTSSTTSFFNSGLQTVTFITYKPSAHPNVNVWLKCATAAITMSASTLRLLCLFCDVTNMFFVECVNCPWFHAHIHCECANSTLHRCIFAYFSVWTVYTQSTLKYFFFSRSTQFRTHLLLFVYWLVQFVSVCACSQWVVVYVR